MNTCTLLSCKWCGHVSIHSSRVYRASVLSKGLSSPRDKKINKASLCHHFQIKKKKKIRPNVQEMQCSNEKKNILNLGSSWRTRAVTLRALYNLLLCKLLFWEETDTIFRSATNGNFGLNSWTSVGLHFLSFKLRSWINSVTAKVHFSSEIL